jgi:HAD superfamily hydrolase (TIGR01509 family)
MALKVILTDLDGVIRHFPSQRDGAIEASLGLPFGVIAGVAFSEALLQQAITGRITDEAWRAAIRANLAQNFGDSLAQRAVDQWSESSGEVHHEVLEPLLGLKGKFPLMLLTNATSRLKRDLTRLGIWHQLDRVFNSSEIGIAKPDPRIFEHVLGSLGCKSAEVLFIDDSSANVAAGRTAGFQVLHFQRGVTCLEDELSKFN